MVLPFEPLFFGFRPRPRRCASRSVNAIRFGGQLLARQLIERDALANDPGNRDAESLAVCHLAIVEAERLLIEITKQMERFYRNIGPVDPALEQAPKIFHPLGMNNSVNILHGVIHNLMLELI